MASNITSDILVHVCLFVNMLQVIAVIYETLERLVTSFEINLLHVSIIEATITAVLIFYCCYPYF